MGHYQRETGKIVGLSTLILIGIVLLAFWPWLLGTWVAARFGAAEHGAAWNATAWTFEATYAIGILAAITVIVKRSRQRAEATARARVSSDPRVGTARAEATAAQAAYRASVAHAAADGRIIGTRGVAPPGVFQSPLIRPDY